MNTQPIPYATSEHDRQVAAEPDIAFRNRFVEQNPVLSTRPVAAIVRPALRKYKEIGAGPVRGTFSAPSLFGDKLFIVSGTDLFTLAPNGTVTFIASISTESIGDVSWAAVANIGTTPARLFFTEGGVLWVYADSGQATGTLTFTGVAILNETVRIDNVYYKFTNASVDAGAPAGTLANPWLVGVAGTAAQQIQRLYDAINDTGVAGTDYSTALAKHLTVRATQRTTTQLFIASNAADAFANVIQTTETGAQMSWGAATLQNGGQPNLRQATMPEDVGAISIAHINSYVIVVPVQSMDLESIGKFFWIHPGETYVDPLDFATAERAPDSLHQVGVFGSMFWLFGQVTTEPWLTTGDENAPMQRYQSILFDRGSWAGTAIQVKDSLIVVDEEGGVFQIQGGNQGRISTPAIEEIVRRAIQYEKFIGA